MPLRVAQTWRKTVIDNYLELKIEMKEQRHYQSPRVLKEVVFQLEDGLLAASIVDKSLQITSNGQETKDINAADEQFQWNDKWTWE